MTRPLVFISYTRKEPFNDQAHALFKKIRVAAPKLGIDVFIDSVMISGGELRKSLTVALDDTTHFIAMLCDDYWESQECKRELHHVLRRYEAARRAASPAPSILFVKAGETDPRDLTFEGARSGGELSTDDARIISAADLIFLGPYGDGGRGRLQVLKWHDSQERDDQLGQLRDRLKETLRSHRSD